VSDVKSIDIAIISHASYHLLVAEMTDEEVVDCVRIPWVDGSCKSRLRGLRREDKERFRGDGLTGEGRPVDMNVRRISYEQQVAGLRARSLSS